MLGLSYTSKHDNYAKRVSMHKQNKPRNVNNKQNKTTERNVYGDNAMSSTAKHLKEQQILR